METLHKQNSSVPPIRKPADMKEPPGHRHGVDLKTAAPAHLQAASVLNAQLPEPSDTYHFLNRISFGPTGADLERMDTIGWEAYLEEQLDWKSINNNKVENYVKRRFPRIRQKTPKLFNRDNYDVYFELKQATIYRALESKRQLYEVMVQFWSNHFSIFHRDDFSAFLKPADDRTVIRPNALGTFRDLLLASANSPAMLVYLDNHVSTKQAPNENYARELLELHTMGADNGYTHDDVIAVARCFTGQSIEYDNASKRGELRFYGRAHDNDSKTLLGETIPAGGGKSDVRQVVDILAAHESTAWHISFKLCRHFVADEPPNGVVNAVKNTYLQTGGDIKAMLRTLFGHQQFWNSKDQKFRRPMEWLIAMLRAWPVKQESNKRRDEGLMWYLYSMGQAPFEWGPPDGYPDEAASWANTNGLLGRWNYGIYYGHGWLYGYKDGYQKLLKETPKMTPREWVDYFEDHLLRRPLANSDKNELINYAAGGGDPDTTRSSWAEERMIKGLMAMVFNSPYFQYR